MVRRNIQLPDVDPSISQAGAGASASSSDALKGAVFSIGVIVFLVVVSAGWSQLAKLRDGQQIKVSATERLER